MENLLNGIANNPMTFFVTVFSSCVAGYIAYRLNHINRFAAASTAFRQAFAPELSAITSPTATSDVRSLLVNAFPRHSEAVIIFRHNLNWLRKRQFDFAWKQYHSGHCFDAGGFDIPPVDRLFLDYFSLHDKSAATALATRRINELLHFAR